PGVQGPHQSPQPRAMSLFARPLWHPSESSAHVPWCVPRISRAALNGKSHSAEAQEFVSVQPNSGIDPISTMRNPGSQENPRPFLLDSCIPHSPLVRFGRTLAGILARGQTGILEQQLHGFCCCDSFIEENWFEKYSNGVRATRTTTPAWEI